MRKTALRRRESVADGTAAFYFEKTAGFAHQAGQSAAFTLVDPPMQSMLKGIGVNEYDMNSEEFYGYWISAFVWFWYGIQKRDRNIYLPCVGWLLLDGAVAVGVIVYR